MPPAAMNRYVLPYGHDWKIVSRARRITCRRGPGGALTPFWPRDADCSMMDF